MDKPEESPGALPPYGYLAMMALTGQGRRQVMMLISFNLCFASVGPQSWT